MDKNSKIAFVMPWHISERGGGAEVQANYLAKELAHRGFSVSYVCQTTITVKIETTTTIDGVEIHWLKAAPKFAWMNINPFLRKLKVVRPDVIIQRNSSPILMASARYRKAHLTKLIWICTDNLAPFKNFFRRRYKDRNDKKTVGYFKYHVFYANAVLSDLLRNKAMRQVDLVLSQNTFQKTELKRNFGKTSAFMISGHPCPDKKIEGIERTHILWCANFGKHKRPELFIELARQMQGTPYQFVMVGGHADKAYVNQLLQDKPKNVTVTGHLSFDEALRYFEKALVFVNTSAPGGDGFPNTFIQSWMRGVPILSYGFNPDQVLTNNKVGFVASSSGQAKSILLDLLNDQKMYLEMSSYVRDYAKKNHSVTTMTDHFLNTTNTYL